MKFEKIKTVVKKSLEILFKNDQILLEHDVSERSITHKLAIYLENILIESLPSHSFLIFVS